MGSDADLQAVLSLYFDFTKMIPSKVTYKLGLRENAPEIVKPILNARDVTIPKMANEFAYVPKMMQNMELNPEFATIIYSLKNNRKSAGRRLDFCINLKNYRFSVSS